MKDRVSVRPRARVIWILRTEPEYCELFVSNSNDQPDSKYVLTDSYKQEDGLDNND